MTGIYGSFSRASAPALAPTCHAAPLEELRLGWSCAVKELRDEKLDCFQLAVAQVPQASTSDLGCRSLAQLRIVADCRIDNRPELAEMLALPKESATWPDEDFILQAYLKWGEAGFEKLCGDFAFALWDARSQQLHLVRDQLGQVPFCYFERQGRIVFSTCLRALLAHPALEKEVNEETVGDFLSLSIDDGEQTFYRGISRLPGGHRLVVTETSTVKRRYYELELSPQLNYATKAEYFEKFRALLLRATQDRLRSAEDPAFMLSGGLDSSSLVGIALQEGWGTTSRPIRTYSGLFPDYPHIDEKSFIEKVHAKGSFDPIFRRMDRESPLGRLEADLKDHGEPFFSPNNYVDTTILAAAQSAGTHLLLDGLDGDTTVGHGWEHLGQLFRERRLRRMYRQASWLGKNTSLSPFFFIYRHALRPTWLGLRAKWWGVKRSRPPGYPHPELSARLNLTERASERLRSALVGVLDPYRKQHLDKLKKGFVFRSFELAYGQGQVRGIVRRHPYHDRRLIEYCVSLPPEMRLNGGADRLVQRVGVKGWPPEEIRTRLTKSIWETNTRDRFLQDDRKKLEHAIEGFGDSAGEYIDLPRFRKAIDFALNHPDRHDSLPAIWCAITVGNWLAQLGR